MQERLQAAIVGIKIKVEHIDAKYKLSQNRESQVYEAVSKFLEHSQNPTDLKMLKWMQISSVMKS